MASSSIKIKYAFGENVDAIVWRANWPHGHMDGVCEKILSEFLSVEETDDLKNYGSRLYKIIYESKIRDKKLSLLSKSEERAPISYYLAPNLEGFENVLDLTNNLAQEAYMANAIKEDLMKSTFRSVKVLRKVARFYSRYWEKERRAEIDTIAESLQQAVDDLPDPIEKVEKTLRGSTGVKDINYYIVDNLYPTCRMRHFDCQRWFVGWADPLEFARPKYVTEIVCGEALHLIPQYLFTEKRRHNLTKLLKVSLGKQQRQILARYANPHQKLLECIEGASEMLMEGYGHAFIGFPWIEDEVPNKLSEPRQMGKEGTPYFESYHFTKWFHDHWKEFLQNPSMGAKDWALQCFNENMAKFVEIAQKFLEGYPQS